MSNVCADICLMEASLGFDFLIFRVGLGFGLGLVNTFLYSRFFDVCFEVLHITVIRFYPKSKDNICIYLYTGCPKKNALLSL